MLARSAKGAQIIAPAARAALIAIDWGTTSARAYRIDAAGTVVGRAVLGEDCQVLENPADTWHAVLSLDRGGVIFEVKHGPYAPLGEADIAAWGKGLDTAALNKWYAVAHVGDKIF